MTERTIREIIEGQEPLTAPSEMSVAEAARLMKQRNVGAMMVVDDGKLVGMFTKRDALFRVLSAGSPASGASITGWLLVNCWAGTSCQRPGN